MKVILFNKVKLFIRANLIRFAKAINNKLNSLTWIQRKRWVFAFTIVFSFYGVAMMYAGMKGPSKAIVIQPISTPAHSLESGEPPPPKRQPIHSELQIIEKFAFYLDSLQHDSAGRKVYDSIRQARPGLVDSLNMVRRLYHLTE